VVPSFKGLFIILSISEGSTQISARIVLLRHFQISLKFESNKGQYVPISTECAIRKPFQRTIGFQKNLKIFLKLPISTRRTESAEKSSKWILKNAHSTEREEILKNRRKSTEADI